MLRKIVADLRSAAGFVACIAQLPDAIRMSFNPQTETQALIVSSQLDLERTSLKLFDYTLPFAGGVVFFFDRFHSKTVLGLWWAVLALVCFGTEIFLNWNAQPSSNPIENARTRARYHAVICMLLTTVWSTVAILIWSPNFPANPIFIQFILCCTLAALATMSSLHAASVAAPLALVSVAVIAVPFIKDIQNHLVLIGLSVIYVLLMITHACMIQIRTARMLELENERSELIENLRNAKLESDLAHEQAVAASRAKSEFLANMSHELRTPLNAIIGFSDIVRSKAFGDASAKYSEYGSFIHQSGHHLLALISDILDLAKIEAGKKVLRYTPVDLRNIILDAVQRVSESANTKSVSLVPSLPPAFPLLSADPQALRQILDNLLSNAVRFTPAGGQIEISVFQTDTGEIALTVSDTGIGIAPEDQAHIFTRLGHRRPEITIAERGTGLGLPIVKGLVDMHGGRIELHSTPGEGTCVAVFFPPDSTIKDSGTQAA
jgi:two-component system cell cycle sensor histidine kinase PleC